MTKTAKNHTLTVGPHVPPGYSPRNGVTVSPEFNTIQLNRFPMTQTPLMLRKQCEELLTRERKYNGEYLVLPLEVSN